jgi:Tol biopolymer transport system component
MGPKEIGAEWPVVLPRGKALLFRRRAAGQAAPDFEIVAMKLPHGAPHVVTRGIYARYAPTGHLIVVTSDGKLVAFPFDAGKLEVSGPPVALYEGLEANPFRAEVALSNTGTLVYANATTSELRDVVWVNRQGGITPVDTAWRVEGVVAATALSPDGRQIAVGIRSGIQGQIWVKSLPNGPYSRITFGDSSFLRPSWSADGKEILYLADRGDGAGTPMAKRADGVGSAHAIYTGKRAFGQVNESADGKWLILRTPNSESNAGDIMAVKLGDTTLVPLVVSPAREGQEALSADGKWLAYASSESGTFEVYVRPFPDAASARWQVSTAGGLEPAWSHSGRELYFRNSKNELVVAEIKTTPTFQVGAQKVMFSLLPFAPPGAVTTFEVTADDSKFLFMRQATNAQANEMIVTENWFPELTAKVKR